MSTQPTETSRYCEVDSQRIIEELATLRLHPSLQLDAIVTIVFSVSVAAVILKRALVLSLEYLQRQKQLRPQQQRLDHPA